MSDEQAIEDQATPETAKKNGKGRLVKAVVLLLLLGAGGGGAYAYVSGGLADKRPGAKEANVPQLVLKGEEDPYAPPETEGEDEAAAEVLGEGGSKYRTAYFLFTEEFTSNLRNSAGLIQVSIAAATHHDGRVLMWLNKHELALRSRILVELADTPEEEALTPEGKARLQQRLVNGMNEVLTEAEGFGGVDDVYFRSMLIQ